MQVRPFEPLGMTTAAWAEIRPTVVTIEDLTFCQEHLSVNGLIRAMRGTASYCGDPLPHVVAFEGKLYVSDGHHRVMAALLRGDPWIAARVLVR